MTTEKTILKCKNPHCEKDFHVIPQEADLYKRKNLPSPDFCPECRHRQRMALRNERKLYGRPCGKCQKQMLSTYPETAPYTVYCQECFWANIG
ncbi:hypothetical protein HOG48_00285 [Candidatus Peregrinibacteria bacterium]|jgi:hypothetical protein|nr:hypothetical protein [Candidatus Peregrinibacteria bacterium]